MLITKEMYENLKKHGIDCIVTVHESGSIQIHPLDKDSLLRTIDERENEDKMLKNELPVVTVVGSGMSDAEKQRISDFFVAHQVKGVSKEAAFDAAAKFADEAGLDRTEFVMKAMDTVNEYRKDISANITADLDEAKNPYRENEQDANLDCMDY